MATNARVTGRGDEVEQAMNAVIPEPGVTFDARLFGQNVIILAFEVTHDLLETAKGLGRIWF